MFPILDTNLWGKPHCGPLFALWWPFENRHQKLLDQVVVIHAWESSFPFVFSDCKHQNAWDLGAMQNAFVSE